MAVFHYVMLRAFAHETEDPARVKDALRVAANDDRVVPRETFAEGSHGNRIVILESEVKGAPAMKRMFAQLASDDPEGFQHVVRSARERVDEHLNLHFRLDKQEAAQGRLRLASDDDAITVRAKLRSFEPKRSAPSHEGPMRDLEAFLLGVRPPAGSVVGE